MWASGELKRHEPTARRLEQLRRAGASAHSPVLTAVVGLAGLGLAALALGRPLLGALGALLAQDLQYGARTDANTGALLRLMAGHLALTTGLLAAIAGGALVLLHLGHGLQSGAALPGGGLRAPLGPTGPGSRRRSPGAPAGDVLVALAAVGAVVWLVLGRLAAASEWGELTAPSGWRDLAWRALAVLGGLGALHLVVQRQRFQARARMSDRELAEEQRQTQGPALTRQRPDAARAKGRQRG